MGVRCVSAILTLGHVDQAACEQSHTVGGLVVVQVLKAPAAIVRLLVHEPCDISNDLEEALLLVSIQVLIQEVICCCECNQRVCHRNFIPRSIFDKPATHVRRLNNMLKWKHAGFHHKPRPVCDNLNLKQQLTLLLLPGNNDTSLAAIS